MRLRQAHAILEAATALEASGLDIQMYPFDHDGPGNRNTYGQDYMTGSAEFADANGRNARLYNINIAPGPGDSKISVAVDSGLGSETTPLVAEVFDVSAPDPSGESFRGLIGARVAEVVGEAIRQREGRVTG